MASVNVTLAPGPRREYVAILPFNQDFFSYSTTTNFTGGVYQTTGALGSVAGANLGNCPAGRILRENGKKLFPDANPGVTTYMVGVYDATTFLNGYINPNSPVFQPMNTDKPTYLDDGVDTGSYSGKSNIGPGVYTAGDVVVTGPNGIIGLGDCLFGNTGAYGEIYQVDNSYVGIEAGDCSGNTYAGLYSDGTVFAASNITSGGVVAGGLVQVGLSGTGGATLASTATEADLYLDPRLANIWKVTTSATCPHLSTVYIYCGTSFVTPINPVAGANYTLIVQNNGSNAAVLTTNGPNMSSHPSTMRMAAAAGYYTISFVSDGSTLIQTAKTGPNQS